MATISDIVKTTGLSRTTVAEVLRGVAGYRQATRDLVFEAAQTLQYRPNYLSKALSGGKSMTIGILVPTVSRHVMAKRLWEAEAKARDHGYISYIATGWGSTTQDPTLALRYLDDMLRRRVDGLIMFRDNPHPPEIRKLLDSNPVPRVYFEVAPPEPEVGVHVCRTKATQDLARHLVKLGHKRAAYMAIDYHIQRPHVAMEETIRTLEEHGVKVDPVDEWLHPRNEDTLGFMQERLRAKDRIPSVLLAMNDERAIGVVAALQRAGMRVPQDVSVVGTGDMPIASNSYPTLTTIRLPLDEVGGAAFEMLHQMMTDPHAQVTTRTLECRTIFRESTGPISPAASADGYIILRRHDKVVS